MNLTFDGFYTFFIKYAESIVEKLVSISKSDKTTKSEFVDSRAQLFKTLSELRPEIDIETKFEEIHNAAKKQFPDFLPGITDVIIVDCLINYFEHEFNKLSKNEYIVEEFIIRDGRPFIQKRIYDITKLPKGHNFIIMGKYDDERVVLDYDQPIDLSDALIFGDFDCSKQKAEFKFPKNINGRMICRGLKTVRNAKGQKISAFPDDFVLPEDITELDCSHSGINLAQLCMLKIPETLETIIIEHSFINQITKRPENLELVKTFIHKHPDINIVSDKDKKISLLDAIEQSSESKSIAKRTPTITVKTQTKTVYNKTVEDLNSGDILERIDIVSLCKQFNITEIELKRQIRTTMKQCVTYERQHEDGITKCINVSQLDAFIEQLISALKSQNNTSENIPEKTEEKNQSNKKTTHIAKLEESTNAKEQPIVIKKYISKNIWNMVKKACGKDIAKQKSVLKTICSINLDPRLTSDNSTLQILDKETNIKTICSFLEKKGTQGISQSIDTARIDRKRLVWTYLPENQILVCVGYFADHQGASKIEYVSAICNAKCGKDVNGRKIESLEIIQSDKYYDAEKILEEFEINEIFAILQKTDITSTIASQIVQHYTNALITILDKEIKNRSKMLQNTNKTEKQQVQTTNIQKLISTKKQIEQDITKVNLIALAGILKSLQYS